MPEQAFPATGPGTPIQERRFPLAFAVTVLLSVVLLVSTKSDVTQAGNETSRLAVVQSLVDGGTFAIDGSLFQTVDKVRIDGRFYSDKPLLLSLCLAAVYWALATLLGLSFASHYHVVVFLVNALGMVPFVILLFLVSSRVLAARGVSRNAAIGFSALLVLSTWILSYGATVNNHTPAAALLMAVLWLGECARKGPSFGRLFWLFFVLGLLLNVEIPFGAIAICVYGATVLLALPGRRRFDGLAAIGSGLLVPAMLMAGLNWLAHGNILPAYMVRGAYDFPGNIHSGGVAGLREAPNVLLYAWHTTFGCRGVFSYMPALLLAVPWVVSGWRSMSRNDVAALLVVVLAFLFYFKATGDYGGWAYGFRFMIPAVPVLWIYSCLWIHRRWHSAWRPVFLLCVGVGVLTSAIGAYNPWPVCDEGASTASGSADRQFKCAFTANALAFTYEYWPDSILFRVLCNRVYTPDLTVQYLKRAFRNMRKYELAVGAPPG